MSIYSYIRKSAEEVSEAFDDSVDVLDIDYEYDDFVDSLDITKPIRSVRLA